MQPTQDRWKEDLHESEVGARDDMELELDLEDSGGRSVICCLFLPTHKAYDSHMIHIQSFGSPIEDIIHAFLPYETHRFICNESYMCLDDHCNACFFLQVTQLCICAFVNHSSHMSHVEFT